MEIRVFDGKNRRIECFARNKFKTNVSSLHLNGCQGHQTVFSVSSVLRLMRSQVEGAHPTRFHFICTNPITPLLVASNLRNYLLYAFSIITIISKNSLNVSVLQKSQRYFISFKRNQVISNRRTPNQYQTQTTLWVHHILVCSLISISCQTSHLTYIQFPENLTTMSELHKTQTVHTFFNCVVIPKIG